MIGAVVGVQPFGSEGLSSTSPKAGGPRFLHRFAVERTAVAAMVTGIESTAAKALGGALRALSDQVLPAVERAVPAFWKRLGKPRPGKGGAPQGRAAVSLPRAPRSSIAR